MDDRTIDEGLRAAVRRNRAVSAVAAAGLTLALVVLLSLGPDGAAAWMGLGGMALFVTAGWLVLVPASRPAPDLGAAGDASATLVRSTSVPALVLVVGSLGLVLVTWSFVVGGDLVQSAQDRRGGLLLYPAVALSPVLLAFAAVVAVRPDRVALTRTALLVRRFGREQALPWQHLRAVEPVPGNPGLVLRVISTGTKGTVLATRNLGLTVWEMRAVLQHYRDHPADCAELGSPASVERIETLRAASTVAGPEPRWFAAPRTQVRP